MFEEHINKFRGLLASCQLDLVRCIDPYRLKRIMDVLETDLETLSIEVNELVCEMDNIKRVTNRAWRRLINET